MESLSSGTRVSSHLCLAPKPALRNSPWTRCLVLRRGAHSCTHGMSRVFPDILHPRSRVSTTLIMSSILPLAWRNKLLQVPPGEDTSDSVSWLAGGRGSCWAGTLQGSHDQEGAEHKAQGHRLAIQEQSDSPAWEASYPPRALVGTPWGFQQLPNANPVQQVFKPSRAFYHASLNSSSLCSLPIAKATSTSVGVCYSNTPFPGSRICVSFLGLP